MAVTAKLEAEPCWLRTLQGADSLVGDLGVPGTWVGPRIGPLERTPGARRQAARETGLPLGGFPEDCPCEENQLLDPGFLPGNDG